MSLGAAAERGLPAPVLAALEKHEDDRNANEKKAVLDYFAWASAELQLLTVRIAKLQSELSLLESSIPKVIYTERTKPRVTRILPRSNWMDETGEIVQPEAEIIHDIALSISGLLVERFGGPSVRPYQLDGYLAAVNFPKREYSASHGDDLYRRALYTQWQRTFPAPSLLAFDAPTREECGVNRVNSNTPLQAFVLLNDPIFVEAARVFGANILKSGGARWEDQLNWAFARA